MTPPALLLVFAEPGGAIPETEFHDWYDNEHIPLRVDQPAFTSWTRFEAADSETPRWAALYDLTSYKETQEAPYTTLADTRSEREKGILAKMGLLDRRIYELYEGSPIFPPSALFDEKKPAPFIIFRSMEVKPEAEEDYNKWFDEEHIPMLAKCPGWIRSRRFVLKDSHRVGVNAGTDQSPPPKYLGVHEWASLDGMESEEYKQTKNTPWRAKVAKETVSADRRVFKFYKNWEKKE